MKVEKAPRPFLLALLVLSLSLTLPAQAQKGALADIAFLEGHWLGTYNGGPIEASWTAPKGDNIIGYIRMMKEDKATMYELFVFEQTDKGPVAMVKHFKPGMVGLEEKDKHDHYSFLQMLEKNQALFEKDDASVRIIYELRKPDQLVIRRANEKDGSWRAVDLFVFERIK